MPAIAQILPFANYNILRSAWSHMQCHSSNALNNQCISFLHTVSTFIMAFNYAANEQNLVKSNALSLSLSLQIDHTGVCMAACAQCTTTTVNFATLWLSWNENEICLG